MKLQFLNTIKHEFKVEIISKKPKKINNLLCFVGSITIDDFTERFNMPLNSWPIEWYLQQWREGLQRIETHDTSCLVATVQNLNTDPFVVMWVLYKKNNTVYIQNNLLINSIVNELKLPHLLHDFNPTTCYQFITKRETITETGEKISEWETSLNAIEYFIKHQSNLFTRS